MPAKIDISPGKVFSRLTVVREAPSRRKKTGASVRRFECTCICGKSKVTTLERLRNGETKSCGCWNKVNPPHLRHGMGNSRFHKIWKGIKSRCDIRSTTGYKHYGGRGISYCKEWGIFENFMKDMHSTYLEASKKFGEKNVTIERKDSNGNYEKANCEWIHKNKQPYNGRRKCIFDGLSIAQLSKKTGILVTTLSYRIYTAKMPRRDAIKKPVRFISSKKGSHQKLKKKSIV